MRPLTSKWAKKFVSVLNEVISEKSAKASKEFMGFVTPHQDYNQIADIIQRNLMPDFSDLRFIPGSITPGKYNPYAGKFLSLQGEDNLVEMEDQKLKDAKVIVSPGLGGGDNETQLKYSLKEFRKLFPDAIIYSPSKEGELREDRYIEGLHYYQNENYINADESNNFFSKVILPKITDNDGKLLKPQDVEQFTLVGFSIGSRENRSHLEVMHEFLLKNGVAKDETAEYFNKISVVNIGSPINWNSLRDDSIPSFTTNIISLTDMGARKPESLFNAVYLDSDCHRDDLSVFSRPSSANKLNHLLVFGNNVVPVISERGVNKNGHDLAGYTKAILAKDKTLDLIRAHRDFGKNSFPISQVSDIIGDVRKYQYDRQLQKSGVEDLVDSWGSYSAMVVAEESKAKLKKNKSRKEDIPSGSVCSDGDVIDAQKYTQQRANNLQRN